jgi:alanyl-tRNA synthetase
LHKIPLFDVQSLCGEKEILTAKSTKTAKKSIKQMMTKHNYYTDSYTTRFEATLLEVTEHEGRPALLLDQTYFYPTSGGQANDLGSINGWRVVDVVAGENGQILHLLESLPAPAPLPGPVQGEIDWPRRYDHMQQHSGQHLLSQLFYRLFGMETVSVHFGEEDSTLDLDAAAVTAEQLAQAESAANDLVYAALPILAYGVHESEIAKVPLRRPPKVSGEIRIVEIQGFDYSACGGTHVHTTAEIGPVKLLRQERRRGQTRITFLCGKRAVADYAHKHELLTQAAAVYSTDIDQVPELLARAQDQVKTLQRQVDELTVRLLSFEVADIVATAKSIGGHQVVVQSWADRSVDAVKTLTNLLQTNASTIALLATTAGGKATVIFARSSDVDTHMGNLLRDALKAFGGGGGGRPEYAQGGGVAVEQVPALLEYAVNQLRS